MNLTENVDWGKRAQQGFLASGIDPADRRGHKNYYIDLLQKMVLEEVLELKGDEVVLDFGCGSGRIAYWIAPKVNKVVGLEITPEMIDLAEKNRTAMNVEFMLYDGVHFSSPSIPFDLIFSVWVLQYMNREELKKTLAHLAEALKRGGKLFLIEQASDNPKVGRPGVEDYLQAFKESTFECLRYYPIRNGRWWLLYLIRYGLVPKKFLPALAKYEITKRREEKGFIAFYKDFLFLLEKGQ